MTWQVLISAPYMIPVIDRFRPWFAEHDIEITVADVQERLEEADLLPIIAKYHGIVCGDDRITKTVIDAAANLKVISKWGTGIDSIDSAYAATKGIPTGRTLDAFTQPVADTALGYILSFARNLPWMDKMMKAGIWDKIPGRALNESTIGVVGVGCMGSAVLRRAKPFGARLLGNDIRTIDPAFVAEVGVEMMDLDSLLEQSDFVSVCCDLNPTSYLLFNDERFKRMKAGSVLVNTARGPVVQEEALVRALQSGKIVGCALDVFEHEPLPKTSALLGMDNVMLAPHNSNSSPKAWERIHHSTLKNLLDGLRG
ncbi:D-3-phosphoglycerate dehydrogenase [Paramagnetospirillum magnetotacticum MS-1]|uniref:D-3-phosphoglycerate dehydrogenase n=1 Tax=Paramagnetospirillum magnetotacticum MS-1 TaxID=272627 RepID=A0A0C2U8G2_PARME|nr:NAD(P)-dependent oxidoreductase [Paramagnetospirillum magnetotacticum]KIL97792.1 D-3-phosphoglycerate dehydrogenase [Paramagnetospirillum magnetotacticum MS-1]